jgi:hypothetical protein
MDIWDTYLKKTENKDHMKKKHNINYRENDVEFWVTELYSYCLKNTCIHL